MKNVTENVVESLQYDSLQRGYDHFEDWSKEVAIVTKLAK